MWGRPTTHSSAPVDLLEGLQQHVHALVRAHQAEARGSPGPPRPRSSGGRGAPSGRRVRWSNAPWGITCTRSGSAPKRSTSSVAPARACTTSASMRRTSRRVTGSRSPSPRRSVLCTVSTRGRAGGSSSESSASSVQPLVVAHVGRRARGSGSAACPARARPRAPARRAPRAAARGGGAPVEPLGHREAVHGRRRAVHEAARDQLHVGARARQRAGEGVVVGQRPGARDPRAARARAHSRRSGARR